MLSDQPNNQDLSKFFVNSFLKNITVQMNPPMAIELCKLIARTPDVPKEVYAMAEKIKTQFHHMRLLPKLESALREEIDESRSTGQLDSDEGGNLDTGAAEAA